MGSLNLRQLFLRRERGQGGCCQRNRSWSAPLHLDPHLPAVSLPPLLIPPLPALVLSSAPPLPLPPLVYLPRQMISSPVMYTQEVSSLPASVPAAFYSAHCQSTLCSCFSAASVDRTAQYAHSLQDLYTAHVSESRFFHLGKGAKNPGQLHRKHLSQA